jgi:Fimbrial assembly protein (PilN)
MALPQQVLERLSREPPRTPGWSSGLLMFSGGILFIALLVYFGLLYGYEPYLNGQISGLTTQINTAANSVSSADRDALFTFYSEVANLNDVLGNHVTFSHFLSWLEKNTEANVYYTQMTLAGSGQITLAGNAATEADVNQQVAIFEASPDVASVNLSTVSAAAGGSGWSFNLTIKMNSISNLSS